MRVLGIDPGLRTLGWGVIDVDGPRLAHVGNGQCRSSGPDLAARLLSLHVQLTEVLAASRRIAPRSSRPSSTRTRWRR
jgi:crossover junction endodeoxyribonuclease RuvC